MENMSFLVRSSKAWMLSRRYLKVTILKPKSGNHWNVFAGGELRIPTRHDVQEDRNYWLWRSWLKIVLFFIYCIFYFKAKIDNKMSADWSILKVKIGGHVPFGCSTICSPNERYKFPPSNFVANPANTTMVIMIHHFICRDDCIIFTIR